MADTLMLLKIPFEDEKAYKIKKTLPVKVIFMGTPDFAIPTFNKIINSKTHLSYKKNL